MNTQSYFFLLGRVPELSLRELGALLPGVVIEQLSPQLAKVEVEDYAIVDEAFEKSGGSLKLLQIDGEFSDITEEQLFEYVVAYLAQFPRPTFAIAELGRDSLPKIGLQQVKNALKARNLGSRFVESAREGLSAAVLLHQGVTELNVIRIGTTTYFAKTTNIQDIDNWTNRDRRKPYSNRKKGMLPPKLARVMLNLATNVPGKYLYDPFCGTGTVLLEAAMLGYTVAGSDADVEAVEGTRDNLAWFEKAYQRQLQSTIFLADATQVKLAQLGGKVDAIVTEPFLGKPKPTPTQLPNIFKGLGKMYLGAFKQWTSVLQDKAKVVIVFPYAVAGKETFSLEEIIDKLVQFGYTPLFEPVRYSRPDAVIQRQIWTFEYQTRKN